MTPTLLFASLLAAAAPARPAADTSAPRATFNLMPVPRSVVPGVGRFVLDTAFRVSLAHHDDPRLDRAIARVLERLERRLARPLPRTLGRGSDAPLVVDVARRGSAIPTLGDDESYRLAVTPERVTLSAPTVVGAIRGLETVLQLVTGDSANFYLPAVTIEDAPRFPWRGLLVDVARHFEPVEELELTLDGMAAVKLNVLHWHLSDDQGFRVESKRFPRLQRMGSDGLYYTQAQIREVVAYAADRGIRVVPEFDMPGHATSWFVGYPELASSPGPYQLERRWGVFPPTMDPTRESTYRFLDRFIGEMTTLFPDRYWHIGGDEVDPAEWKASRRIQAFMRRHHLADAAALQAYFNRRLVRILARHRRTVVGWDEILHPDLPKAAVIQSWRGTDYLGKVAAAGHRGILSAPYYLDHIETAEFHYLADPVPPDAGLTPEEASSVLGGEACSWGEYVTEETMDARVWPRLAAIAERFWSPADLRDVGDMYRRLAVTSARLEELGLRHETSVERMLRRLMQGQDISALRELLRYTRQRGFGGRLNPVQMDPLTHLADAALPDPPERWQMLAAARRLVAAPRDTALADSLRRVFAEWSTLPIRITRSAGQSPLAAEGAAAAAALAALGPVASEAVGYLQSGATPPAEWQRSATALVREIATATYGGLRLGVGQAVGILVDAARGGS